MSMFQFRNSIINKSQKLYTLTLRLTPHSGRSSTAAEIKSFPYLAVKCLRISMSSGMSEHLGDAKITLVIASFKSLGQFLKEYNRSIYYQFNLYDKIITFQKKVGKGERDSLYINFSRKTNN